MRARWRLQRVQSRARARQARTHAHARGCAAPCGFPNRDLHAARAASHPAGRPARPGASAATPAPRAASSLRPPAARGGLFWLQTCLSSVYRLFGACAPTGRAGAGFLFVRVGWGATAQRLAGGKGRMSMGTRKMSARAIQGAARASGGGHTVGRPARRLGLVRARRQGPCRRSHVDALWTFCYAHHITGTQAAASWLQLQVGGSKQWCGARQFPATGGIKCGGGRTQLPRGAFLSAAASLPPPSRGRSNGCVPRTACAPAAARPS